MKYTPQQHAEHPLFEWRDGMRNQHGDRWCSTANGWKKLFTGSLADSAREHNQPTPDLTDPPTLRCILEILRDCFPGDVVYVHWSAHRECWKVVLSRTSKTEPYWAPEVRAERKRTLGKGETEAEALLAALNAVLGERRK